MVNEMKITALTLAILATGCTGGSDVTATAAESTPPPSSTTTAAAEGPDVRLALLPPSRLGLSVAAPGTLEVEGRCLYLRMRNGSRTLPIFATFDTRWNRTQGVLEVGDRSFRPGDAVTLGGSPHDAPPANVAWVQAPDPGCRGDQAFIAYSITPEKAPAPGD